MNSFRQYDSVDDHLQSPIIIQQAFIPAVPLTSRNHINIGHQALHHCQRHQGLFRIKRSVSTRKSAILPFNMSSSASTPSSTTTSSSSSPPSSGVLSALSRLRWSRRWVMRRGHNNETKGIRMTAMMEKMLAMLSKVGLSVIAVLFGIFAQMLIVPLQKVDASARVGVNSTIGVEDSHVTQSEVMRAVKFLGIGVIVVAGVKVLQWSRQGKAKELEVKRAEEESGKLQKMEEERMRGRERRKLEGVGGLDGGLSTGEDAMWGDDALREGLKKRLQSLERGDVDDPETDQDKEGMDKRSMRYKPIPDRGMGSMLLDRPGDEEDDNRTDEKEENEVTASAANVEMLKRMWSLNENDDQGPKKSSKEGK